jgi:DNA-binding transcriptional ArsR family regulator
MVDRTDDNHLLTAVAHPLRRRILREMADGKPTSPRKLADALLHPLSNVSYHVRVLADCGVLTLVETRPTGGSVEHFYRSSVDAPWARQVLGLREGDGAGGGESSGGSST